MAPGAATWRPAGAERRLRRDGGGAGRIATREALCVDIASAGFSVERFEDRSDALKSWAARVHLRLWFARSAVGRRWRGSTARRSAAPGPATPCCRAKSGDGRRREADMDDESFRIAELHAAGRHLRSHSREAGARSRRPRRSRSGARDVRSRASAWAAASIADALSGGCCVLGFYGGRAEETSSASALRPDDRTVLRLVRQGDDREIWRRQLQGRSSISIPSPDAAALPRRDSRLLAEDQGDPGRAPSEPRRAGAGAYGRRS